MVRHRFAKPLFVGSIPTSASMLVVNEMLVFPEGGANLANNTGHRPWLSTESPGDVSRLRNVGRSGIFGGESRVPKAL